MLEFIGPNVVKLYIKDIMYCRTLGSIEDIQAIDPDGGPFISVGQKINIDDRVYIINSIENVTRLYVKTTIEIILGVIEV
jgi:hypothetical protein